MKNNCAFTIVAKNYIGLALILEASIKEHFNDLDFYIIVADEVDSSLKSELPKEVIIAKDTLGFPDNLWNEMSFKYNLTEFCTSIKPGSILHFLNQGYEKVIYIDPDIYFFGSIGVIFDKLNNISILLTPHITEIPDLGESDSPESDWMNCGIYNLGFCGVRKTSYAIQIINWWHARLIDHCFNDRLKAEYTDQKWMDFIPALLPAEEVSILRDLGINMAPWNFFQRKIISKDNILCVCGRKSNENITPLIFVHYSGYNYKSLIDGVIIQNNIAQMKCYPDLEIIFNQYATAIHNNAAMFLSFFHQTYTYNTYDNGKPVLDYHRRLYAALKNRGVDFPAPFSSKGPLYHAFYKHGLIQKNPSDSIKISKKDVGIVKKLRWFNFIMRITYKLLGSNKYFMLVRLFRPYSAYEAQIHIIDKKYSTSNI